MKSFIILSEDNTFYIIIHANPHDYNIEEFQWYVTEEPNSNKKSKIKNQNFESITLSSNIISKKYLNKWIYCKCKIKNQIYNEGCFYLSDDFIDIIRNNKITKISFFDSAGNIRNDNSYIYSILN